MIHDFRPLEASQLALRPGSKVLVLSKEGDSRGWWKGRTIDKVHISHIKLESRDSHDIGTHVRPLVASQLALRAGSTCRTEHGGRQQ